MTKEQIWIAWKEQQVVAQTRARDNERDIHIRDVLVVVSTSKEGFLLMHEHDVGTGDGKVYRVKLEEDK